MATSVRLDPLTGLPTTRIISSATGLRTGSLSPIGPRSGPQIPYTEFGTGEGGTDYSSPNTSAPLFVGYGGPVPANAGGATNGSGSGGGGTGPPDYAALVAADPGLQALRAELAAGNISAAQFRKAAIQRAVIAYGQAPDEAALDPTTRGFYSEDVDQLTKDLAAKNTSEGLSTRAQLDRSHQVALQGLQNVLAARGMLQSGALGVGLGLEGQRDKTENAKATAGLLDYLSGQARAYADHLHQSKLQEAQAIMETTQGYMANYAGSFGGRTGGSSGSNGSSGFNFQYPGLARQNIAAAGYAPGEVEAQISAQMAARGYGFYHSSGGMEAPAIHNDGQIFQDGNGRRYIDVKVGVDSAGTSSTERFYLDPPGATASPTAPPPSGPAPAPAPAAAPAPAPVAPPVSVTPVSAGTIRPGGYF